MADRSAWLEKHTGLITRVLERAHDEVIEHQGKELKRSKNSSVPLQQTTAYIEPEDEEHQNELRRSMPTFFSVLTKYSFRQETKVFRGISTSKY